MSELIIDVGHGGSDHGAVNKGVREKELNLRISLYQYERFKELGIDVDLTRESDVTLQNGTRIELIKQAEFCISNHHNAGGGDRGEVIHSLYSDGLLAKQVKTCFEDIGQPTKVYSRKLNNGQDYYYVHRLSGKTQVTIVEYCFMDNDEDFNDYNSRWEEFAEAVIKAYCLFVNVNYFPPKGHTNSTLYKVQVGSFASLQNATTLMDDLKKHGYSPFLVKAENPNH